MTCTFCGLREIDPADLNHIGLTECCLPCWRRYHDCLRKAREAACAAFLSERSLRLQMEAIEATTTTPDPSTPC